MRGPSRAEDALQVANLLQQVTAAGERALDEVIDAQTPANTVKQLRVRAESRTNAAWERLGPGRGGAEHAERELPQAAADACCGRSGPNCCGYATPASWTHEVLQVVMQMVDLEESMIDRLDDAAGRDPRRGTEARARVVECTHLHKAPRIARPDTPGVCQSCVEAGVTWVHLRMCLTCGHIACCDSSPLRHATAHFVDTEHPVMRSVEPGEAWRWCYVDEILG